MHGQSRREAEERAHTLLGDLALGDAEEEYAVNYSAGMKKKLGLACALIHDPAMLILDEPTNGLDPRAQREVQERLLRSAAEGRTIFLSTHLLTPTRAPAVCWPRCWFMPSTMRPLSATNGM
jgi:ABC-2 type transport system ATP-binding protein